MCFYRAKHSLCVCKYVCVLVRLSMSGQVKTPPEELQCSGHSLVFLSVVVPHFQCLVQSVLFSRQFGKIMSAVIFVLVVFPHQCNKTIWLRIFSLHSCLFTIQNGFFCYQNFQKKLFVLQLSRVYGNFPVSCMELAFSFACLFGTMCNLKAARIYEREQPLRLAVDTVYILAKCPEVSTTPVFPWPAGVGLKKQELLHFE